jgi:formate hydrogenlyase subunit 6/NADH:ubiquinone oxidoreductase subunit I
MAYFSNGSEGMVFDDQCNKCKYGKEACPIAAVQMLYNYDAVKAENNGDKTASLILDALVSDNGTCNMWKEFKHDFEINPNQLNLF